MKKIFLLTILVSSLLGCSRDIFIEEDERQINSEEGAKIKVSTDLTKEYYYWCDGVKIPLRLNNNKFYVQLKTSSIANMQDLILNHNSQNTLKATTKSNDALGIVNNTEKHVSSIILDKIDQSQICMDYVEYIAPFYLSENGAEIGITNNFSVKLSNIQDVSKLQELSVEYAVNILDQNKFDPTVYCLSCTKDSKGNALDMANIFYETGIFEYAAPEFIFESFPASVPNDSYFKLQWNLNNLDQDIDIDYLEAMGSFTFPHINDIIVAVVDNGIYADHEDLNLYNVSYNAHTGQSPSMVYGDHGTMVAGIIGATANNGKGLAGIASGVNIMPVSICYTKDAEQLGIEASTSTNFANAIRFAADNGARVINNSWSIMTSSPIPEINSAITYAHSKGCVVVFASGNDNSGVVSQPADGAPSSTLVVGSIDSDGYRSAFSNYGSSLDLVAPGSNIRTTANGGGYIISQGTSFAAPHIAAIAALIWAVKPDLQAWRVRNIIEQSTKKVGGNEYEVVSPVRLNGTWNRIYGYGLVDAYSALSAINNTAPENPSILTFMDEVNEGDLSMMGLGYDTWNIAYLARGNGSDRCYVENYDPTVTYIWKSTLPPYNGEGEIFYFNFNSESDAPELHSIKCTAIKNGLNSSSGIHIALIPQNYSY